MNNLLVNSGFTIFGFTIKYYGLIIALAMCLGVFVACHLSKKRNLKPENIYALALYILPLAILGARTYYVIFSDQAFTFLEFFKIWEGGLAVYGGIIGGAIGVVLYCIIHKHNFWDIADIACVSLILGQGIGRIGCYFSGCCYGVEVTNPAFQWFPFASLINGTWHYSTYFYESFFAFIIFAVLFYLIKKKVKTRGVILSLYLICYGITRAIIETFRGDSLYFLGMKVSQLLSIILIVTGIILLIIIYTNKNKKVENNEKDNNTSNNSSN